MMKNEQPSFVRIIVKDKDRYLALSEERDGNLWNFPGGKVEQDESFEEAAKRELMEETDLRLEKCIFLFEKKISLNGKKWTGAFFFARRVNGKPVSLETEKCNLMEFFSRKDTMNMRAIRSVFHEIIWNNLVKALPVSSFHEE